MTTQTQPVAFPGAPDLGMSLRQRKEQLDGMRFVDVRNLAYIAYKKADGTPLMTYNDTLNDRELVKATILNYELSLGYITDDGAMSMNSAAPTFAPGQFTTAAPTLDPQYMQQGDTMAQQQFPIAPGFAPPAQQNAPAQQMTHPGMAPPAPQMAPPPAAPQMMAPPQSMMAPPATPQQVAQVAGAPQASEPPAAPRGRGGRRAANAAPPPAAPPPSTQPQQGFAAPQMPMPAAPPAPGGYQQPGFPQQPAPQAQGFAPPPQPGYPAAPAAPPAPVQQPQQVQQQMPAQGGVDLSGVIARLDQIGQGLTAISTGQSQLDAKFNELAGSLSAEIRNLNGLVTLGLTALHHLYSSHQTLGPTVANMTLDQFKEVMAKYAGISVPK